MTRGRDGRSDRENGDDRHERDHDHDDLQPPGTDQGGDRRGPVGPGDHPAGIRRHLDRRCPADRDEQLPAQDPAHGRHERHHDLANRPERLWATDRRRRHDLGADADPRDRHLVHGLRCVVGRERRSRLRQADQECRREHLAPPVSQAQHQRRSDIRLGPTDDLARLEHRRPGHRPALERPGQHRLDRADHRQHLHAHQHRWRRDVQRRPLRRAQQQLRGRPNGLLSRRPPARDRDRRDVSRVHLGPRHRRDPPHAQSGRELDIRQGAQHLCRVRVHPRRSRAARPSSVTRARAPAR